MWFCDKISILVIYDLLIFIRVYILKICVLVVCDFFVKVEDKKFVYILYLVILVFYGCSVKMLFFYYWMVFILVCKGCIERVGIC